MRPFAAALVITAAALAGGAGWFALGTAAEAMGWVQLGGMCMTPAGVVMILTMPVGAFVAGWLAFRVVSKRVDRPWKRGSGT